MLSQSINTEIIKGPNTITQSTLSKTFVLLLIEVHEIIINVSGIDTGGGGDIIVFAIEGIFFFFKGQIKPPILHNTRDGSEFMFLTLRTKVTSGRGLGDWVGLGEREEESHVYYEACLKT